MPVNVFEKQLADIHPELRGKVRGNRYVGAPFFGLASAGAWAQALRLFLTGGAPVAVLCILAAVGVLSAWAAVYAWQTAGWYRRMSWVLQETQPTAMRLHFTRNVAGAPIVTLQHINGTDRRELKILCCNPAWDFGLLEGAVVKAHIESGRSGLIVLDTPVGIVWPLKRIDA